MNRLVYTTNIPCQIVNRNQISLEVLHCCKINTPRRVNASSSSECRIFLGGNAERDCFSGTTDKTRCRDSIYTELQETVAKGSAILYQYVYSHPSKRHQLGKRDAGFPVARQPVDDVIPVTRRLRGQVARRKQAEESRLHHLL